MSAMEGIKVEEDVKIKPDPADAATPSMMDEDEFEDTGELMIRGTAQDDQAWLAKLPKWLWEAWADIAEDEEIELGKVRVYNDKLPGDKPKIKIVLNDLPSHATVPKRYEINFNKDVYNNTVVFSEKDQPGFRGGQAWNRDKRVRYKQEKPAFSNRALQSTGVSKRPYRSSIPKQTALAGFLQHEVTITAVENDEYHALNRARFARLAQPKRTTTFTTGIDHALHPGLASAAAFNSFVNNPGVSGARGAAATLGGIGGRSGVGNKKRAQTDKAVRVSQEQLLDLLQECFKEYRYWSVRALRQRLHQPEVFIKSTLEKVATLIRSGPFTGLYRLRPEYEALGGAGSVKEEAAVEEEGDDEDEDDGDEFEDVKMEE